MNCGEYTGGFNTNPTVFWAEEGSVEGRQQKAPTIELLPMANGYNPIVPPTLENLRLAGASGCGWAANAVIVM